MTAIVQNATPVHVLRRPAGRDGRGRDARQRRPGRASCSTARRPIDIPTIIWRALSKRATGQPPPPGPPVHRRRTAVRSARSTSARCRSRSTATTSARSAEAVFGVKPARDRASSPELVRRWSGDARPLIAAGVRRGRSAAARRWPSVPALRHRAPRCPARRQLPGLPGRQPVEPARRPAARRRRTRPTLIAQHRARATRCTPTSARASMTASRSASRTRSSSTRTRRVPVELRVRRRVRPRPVPDPAQRPDRGRPRLERRPPRDRRRPRHVHATTSCSPPTRSTAARAGRAGSGAIFNLRSNHLRPAGWTSADAAGLPILPGLARYDEVARRRDRPRAALHRAVHRAALRLPGPPRGVDVPRPEPAADGPARPAEGERQHLAASPPGAGRRAGAQALRDDPGRQRLALVHLAARPTRAGTTTRCTCSTGSPAATSRS